MNTKGTVALWSVAISGLLFSAALSGCSDVSHDSGAATRPVTDDGAGANDISQRTGTQLWADNCSRCHYSRPSTEYSAQQWEMIAHHMRLRANLTGDEQRKIAQFLQSGG